MLTTSEAGFTVWSKPTQFSSTILSAFWNASSKFLPMAMTSPGDRAVSRRTLRPPRCPPPPAPRSPTLFMELPILVLTRRNLLRSQRGIFTTQ